MQDYHSPNAKFQVFLSIYIYIFSWGSLVALHASPSSLASDRQRRTRKPPALYKVLKGLRDLTFVLKGSEGTERCHDLILFFYVGQCPVDFYVHVEIYKVK